MNSEQPEIDESELYECAREELKNNNLNEEAWQKAMVLSGHMEANAREKYITMRVAQLKRNMRFEAQYAEQKKTDRNMSAGANVLSETADENIILQTQTQEQHKPFYLITVGKDFFQNILLQMKTNRKLFYLITAGLIFLAVITVIWPSSSKDKVVKKADATKISQLHEADVIEQISETDVNFSKFSYAGEADLNLTESVTDTPFWKLSVLTDPPDANVTILNHEFPYEDGMELSVGKYHINISKKGFVSKSFWIDLDQDINYSVKLSPIELFALTVHTSPGDARVQIMNIKDKYHDGIRLPIGKYRLRVSKKGYTTFEKMINLKKSTVYKAETFTLKRKNFASLNPMMFAEAFPTCLGKDLRLPSVNELDKIIVSGEIDGHEDAWFWTSERSNSISYNVMQNNTERSTKAARLSEKHMVYCVQ